jgi:hypothetical protein
MLIIKLKQNIMSKKHYNEKELNFELKKYLELNLGNFQFRLKNQLKSYEHSQNWLPENKLATEKDIELLQMKVNFYQTQLNNIK